MHLLPPPPKKVPDRSPLLNFSKKTSALWAQAELSVFLGQIILESIFEHVPLRFKEET